MHQPVDAVLAVPDTPSEVEWSWVLIGACLAVIIAAWAMRRRRSSRAEKAAGGTTRQGILRVGLPDKDDTAGWQIASSIVVGTLTGLGALIGIPAGAARLGALVAALLGTLLSVALWFAAARAGPPRR